MKLNKKKGERNYCLWLGSTVPISGDHAEYAHELLGKYIEQSFKDRNLVETIYICMYIIPNI